MYTYKATIYNVVDGDTVDANIDLGFKMYTKQRLRLSHIDTPERGQPGYAEATARLKQLVLGKEVTITTHRQSKWGYFLADIMTGDVAVNQVMINEGFAKPYSGGTKE